MAYRYGRNGKDGMQIIVVWEMEGKIPVGLCQRDSATRQPWNLGQMTQPTYQFLHFAVKIQVIKISEALKIVPTT